MDPASSASAETTASDSPPASSIAAPIAAAATQKQQNSLYEASPTPSDEGGGGASPVKARLATRFFTPPSGVAAASAAAAAAAAALAAGGASSTTSSTLPGCCSSSRSMHPLPSATSHLQDSIYNSSSQVVGRAVSAPVLQQHKHGSSSATNKYGSHTSLVDVEHLAGGTAHVSVELYVPRSGAHTKDTFWPCTFNLSKVILGAGMMAIPKAFKLLGVIPGSVLMLLIACLTFFTLAGLIEASASTGAGSYGGLVRRTLGPKAEATLQFAVFANCYIMEVVFVVVLGDILIGTAPEYGGLLPEWTGVPDPAACWWLRRDVVLGAVSVLVLLPLAAMRSMERLAVVNIIGVASNGVFAGLMLALAAGAASNGVLQPPPLLPDWSNLGQTPLMAAIAIATVVPVLLNCDVCHQSLHPLMPLLQPYSVSRMQRLVAVALATCNTLYMTVTFCSIMVFGDALHSDVLTNVNSAAMAPLIGPTAAALMAAIVRVGYLLSLIGSYVLLVYPLRQCLGDQWLPGGHAAVQRHWLLVTTLIVTSASAIGCYLPTIWDALALVGATTSTVQAFIIPGLVILSVERTAAKQAASQGLSAAAGRGARDSGDESLTVPLLLDAETHGAAGVGSGSGSGSGQHATGQQQASRPRLGGPTAAGEVSAAAAAADQALNTFKVDRAPQPLWRCVVRQIVAVVAVLIGVGLFANSVVDALWCYAHPHAEGGGAPGVGVGGVFQWLKGQVQR